MKNALKLFKSRKKLSSQILECESSWSMKYFLSRELSKMEEDPMIPQRMRDISRTQLCIPEVRAFAECSKASGFSMVALCQGGQSIETIVLN